MADPYQVLKLDRDTATVNDVKKAYYYIVSIYNPEKGGNNTEFQRFQNAYRQIMLEKTSQSRTSTSRQPVQLPQGMSGSKFNREFTAKKSTQNADGYVYNIDETQFVERDRGAYNQQRARITSEAESIKPMFKSGRFNQNVFNRVFNNEKKLSGSEDKHVGLPVPVAGTEIISYSDVNQLNNSSNITQLSYADFNKQRSHLNPKQFDPQKIKQMSRMKDITKEQQLSQAEARRRVADYQSAEIKVNSDPLNTSQSYYMNDGLGGGSQMQDIPQNVINNLKGNASGSVQEAMQRKMVELRQQPGSTKQAPRQANSQLNVLQYPINSHQEVTTFNQNKEMAGQIRDMYLTSQANDFLPDERSGTQQEQLVSHDMGNYPPQYQERSEPQVQYHPSQFQYQPPPQPQLQLQLQPRTQVPQHQVSQHQVPQVRGGQSTFNPIEYFQQQQQYNNKLLMLQQKRNKKNRQKQKLKQTIRMQQKTINQLLKNQKH